MTKGGIVLNGTATGFSKAAVIIGGQAVKLYKGAVIVGGQAVQIFKSAIEWTYALIALSNSSNAGYSYGSTADYSAQMYVLSNGAASCTVQYTLKNPLTMRAGQTVTLNLYNYKSGANSNGYFAINGGSILSSMSNSFGNNTQSKAYAFGSDTTISTIEARIDVSPNESTNWGGFAVTLNSDYGPVFLNNSGTSNNQ